MSLPIRTTELADLQILEIDEWWRTHREKAPDLFEQELALALKTISSAPEAGMHYSHPSANSIRRVLMRATRHHVYYVQRADHILVLSVWGAVKKLGPNLINL